MLGCVILHLCVCDTSPQVATAALCGARVAIKYYAKLIPTHSEANLPLNVTYKVLRSPQLTY